MPTPICVRFGPLLLKSVRPLLVPVRPSGLASSLFNGQLTAFLPGGGLICLGPTQREDPLF